jgi:hypothetical protein
MVRKKFGQVIRKMTTDRVDFHDKWRAIFHDIVAHRSGMPESFARQK